MLLKKRTFPEATQQNIPLPREYQTDTASPTERAAEIGDR